MDKTVKVMHVCGLMDAAATAAIHLRELKKANELPYLLEDKAHDDAIPNSLESILEDVKMAAARELHNLCDPTDARQKHLDEIFKQAMKRGREV